MTCASSSSPFCVYKDPNTSLYYGIEWSATLAEGVTVASSDWEVPDGLENEAEQLTSSTAKVKLSGGTLGEVYDVVNTVTLSTGESDQRTLRVIMKES